MQRSKRIRTNYEQSDGWFSDQTGRRVVDSVVLYVLIQLANRLTVRRHVTLPEPIAQNITSYLWRVSECNFAHNSVLSFYVYLDKYGSRHKAQVTRCYSSQWDRRGPMKYWGSSDKCRHNAVFSPSDLAIVEAFWPPTVNRQSHHDGDRYLSLLKFVVTDITTFVTTFFIACKRRVTSSFLRSGTTRHFWPRDTTCPPHDKGWYFSLLSKIVKSHGGMFHCVSSHCSKQPIRGEYFFTQNFHWWYQPPSVLEKFSK